MPMDTPNRKVLKQVNAIFNNQKTNEEKEAIALLISSALNRDNVPKVLESLTKNSRDSEEITAKYQNQGFQIYISSTPSPEGDAQNVEIVMQKGNNKFSLSKDDQEILTSLVKEKARLENQLQHTVFDVASRNTTKSDILSSVDCLLYMASNRSITKELLNEIKEEQRGDGRRGDARQQSELSDMQNAQANVRGVISNETASLLQASLLNTDVVFGSPLPGGGTGRNLG